VQTVRTSKGQNILVDTALSNSKFVHVVAVGSLGNFSSKLLDDRNVTAIVTEQSGAGLLTAQDIQHAMQSVGAAKDQGIVVVRAGKKRSVELHGHDILEVVSQSELEQDHILHLLGNATESCRTSIHQVAELLKLFARSASTAHSKFHVEKAEGNPAVLHAEGAAGFEKAKHAVERDLNYAMKAHTAQEGGVTYSVHYSDTNGLSRLENYIIAGEIAQYLGKQLKLWVTKVMHQWPDTASRIAEYTLPPLALHHPQPQRYRTRLQYLHLSHPHPLPRPSTKATTTSVYFTD